MNIKDILEINANNQEGALKLHSLVTSRLPFSLAIEVQHRYGIPACQMNAFMGGSWSNKTLTFRSDNLMNHLQSERILRLIDVGHSLEEFVEEDKAILPMIGEWLTSPSEHFANSTPIRLLYTDIGTELVLNTINQ